MTPDNQAYAEPDETLFHIARQGTESLKERLLELYLLYTTSKAFNAATYSDELTRSIHELLRSSLDVEEFCLLVENAENGRFEVWSGVDRVLEAAGGVSFAPGEGVTGEVAQTGQPLLVQDAQRDSRFLEYKGELGGVGGLLSTPLKDSGGRVFAVLNIHRDEPNAFQESDRDLFTAVARNMAPALERVILYDSVRQGAFEDELTGLYNRRYFRDSAERELARARRQGQSLAFLALDLDEFKAVNDRFGHAAGDRILIQLAKVLAGSVRESDLIARYGGEEIAVMLPDTGLEGAVRFGEKLRDRIAREAVVTLDSGKRIGITASVGIAIFPCDGEDLDALLQASDWRLYQAKTRGRNTVVADEGLPDTGPALGDDRRQHPRYGATLCLAARAPVTGPLVRSLDVYLDGRWQPVRIADVSRQGFSFLMTEEPKEGDIYHCRAWLEGGTGQGHPFNVHVCHVEHLGGEDYYRAGVQAAEEDAAIWEAVYTSMIH